MCQPQRPPERAMVSDRHINSSPMANTQLSGFHVVEINGNGGQTIIYWTIGLAILFVIAGGSLSLVKTLARPSNPSQEETGEGAAPFGTLGNGGGGLLEVTGIDVRRPWLPWAAPHANRQPAPIWTPTHASRTLTKSQRKRACRGAKRTKA